MAVIGRWNGHEFEVKPGLIRSFGDLQIKASSKLKDKTVHSLDYAQDVVRRESSNATEVTITVDLHAAAGVDVRKESMAFAAEAQVLARDYFYVGESKLYPCKLALTDATISDVEIAPNGKWVSAEVSLTFKQFSKVDKEFKQLLTTATTTTSKPPSSSSSNSGSNGGKKPNKTGGSGGSKPNKTGGSSGSSGTNNNKPTTSGGGGSSNSSDSFNAAMDYLNSVYEAAHNSSSTKPGTGKK